MNIFRANEEAAQLLQSGQALEAAQAFLRALSGLRTELEAEANDADEIDDNPKELTGAEAMHDFESLRDEIFMMPLDISNDGKNSGSSDSSISTTSKPTEHHHPLGFYTSMFCFTPGTSWSIDSTLVLTAITAIVMFNAGLALQVQGLNTGKSSTMRQALQVYSKCMSLVRSFERGANIPTLGLAACSNMAFIESEFYAFKSLQKSTVTLSSMLHQQGAELDEADRVFFRVQALACKSSNSRRAPAA